jgi:hypothetical protein
MVLAAREMGKTLFESSEYAGRGRFSNTSDYHAYVSDLYWAYLLRAPDQGGWDFWAGLVPQVGAEGAGAHSIQAESSITTSRP